MSGWWFLVLLAVVCICEMAAPRTALSARRSLRWPTSFTLGPLNSLLGTFPLAPFGLALLLRERGWGLAVDDSFSRWLAILATVCLLDLCFYLQHRVFHVVPFLWSVHRVHHADVDFDYTTGLRFHPFEALLTNATALVAVAVLGLPAYGVLLHGAIASGITILEHANARIPPTIESWIGRVFVTPAMHRIHHSAATPETDTNFATIFSFWDRALGTYRPGATSGAEIGLMEFRAPKYQTLPWALAMPFLRLQRAPGAPTPSSVQGEAAK
jgi:sterol desaturase/sphingolipid hydroxylase (fatty acid hydroxylase superfamily)